MPYLITLVLVETISDLVVDRIKMVLARATTIKRGIVVNEVINKLVVFDCVGDGNGVVASAGVGQHEGATYCIRCCGFLCEKCKKHYDKDSIMNLQTLSQTVNEFKNKRGMKDILSKNVQHPYTPHVKRMKESFAKTIQNLKKKMFGEIPRAIMEEVKEYKKLNIYKRMTVAKKINLLSVTSSKYI